MVVKIEVDKLFPRIGLPPLHPEAPGGAEECNDEVPPVYVSMSCSWWEVRAWL